MSKTTLQLRRGTQAENAAFTGALGEVVVDTTRKTLVVHDGATVGGSSLATIDSPAFTGNVTAPTPSSGNNSSKIATTAFVQTELAALVTSIPDTDAITEGTTNLFFTNDRVYSSLAAGGNVTLTQNPSTKVTTISYTQPAGLSAFSNDVGYLTSASILNSLSVVDPSNALTYDNVTGVFTFTQAIATVNGLTGAVVLNSDNISDVGRTNKWASSSVVRSYLSSGTGINFNTSTGAIALSTPTILLNSKSISLSTASSQSLTTDDIVEGSTNLYASATNVRAQLSAGTGVSFTNGQISIGQAVSTSSSVTFSSVTSTDLTINTNLLKSDSANSRVGILNATPAYTLDVAGDINFTGKLRVGGSAGNSGQVLLSSGTGSAPQWTNVANALPEIIEIDRLLSQKNGATTKFNPTSNGVDVTVTYPIQLTIIKNGIHLTPWLNKSGPIWQPLTPFGDYTVDAVGDIVFSTPPQPIDSIFMVLNVGRSVNPVYKTYPFRPIDVMLGT